MNWLLVNAHKPDHRAWIVIVPIACLVASCVRVVFANEVGVIGMLPHELLQFALVDFNNVSSVLVVCNPPDVGGKTWEQFVSLTKRDIFSIYQRTFDS